MKIDKKHWQDTKRVAIVESHMASLINHKDLFSVTCDPWKKEMLIHRSLMDSRNPAKKFKKIIAKMKFAKLEYDKNQNASDDYGSVDFTTNGYKIRYSLPNVWDRILTLPKNKFNKLVKKLEKRGFTIRHENILQSGCYEAGGFWVNIINCYYEDQLIWYVCTNGYYDI